MNIPTDFFVVGDGFSRIKPGFATPIFQCRDSNGLWIQKIDTQGRVASFRQIESDTDFSFMIDARNKTRRVGYKAFYCYHSVDGSLWLDTKGRLKRHLSAELRRLSERPHLKRTLAKFLGDTIAQKQAEADIRAELNRRRSEKINRALLLDNPRAFTKGQLSDLFVGTESFDELLLHAGEVQVVLLSGKRGTGKSMQLYHLKEVLEGQDREVIVLNAREIALSNQQRELTDEARELNFFDLVGQLLDSYQSWDEVPFLFKLKAPSENAERTSSSATLLLDDIDFAFSGENVDATIRAIKKLCERGLDLVLAGDFSRIFGVKTPSFWRGLSFEYVEVTAPTYRQAIELLQRRLGQGENRAIWELVHKLFASGFEGATFREVLEILSFAERSSEDGSRASLNRIVDEFIDRRVSSIPIYEHVENEADVKNVAVNLLDAVAQGNLSYSSLSDYHRDLLDGLTANGLIVEHPVGSANSQVERTFEFAHKSLEDRWKRRRRL